jgi:hypothetical protein
MYDFRRLVSLRTALVATILGGVLLALARPSRSQQPTPQPQDPPAVLATVPATANPLTFTVVQFQFPLPEQFQMVEYPQVRVADVEGKQIELLTLLILRRTPTWAGHRALHIESYAPGVYDVTIQFAYRRPDGTIRKVVTPAKKLLVTAAVPTPAS